jgi:histidinol-phosphate aminotransferase
MTVYSRKCVSEADGYVPGEQPTADRYIKLNTNENPYPPSPRVLEALQTAITPAIRLYPQPTADRLREKIAEVYECAPDQVIVTNGMDELLNLVIRAFVEMDDTVVLTYPTYVLYETLARLHGASTVSVELEPDFSLPQGIVDTEGKLLLLSRPNSPAGTVFDKARVAELAAEFAGPVALDEAYVDFADDDCLEFAGQFENVLVMRTFSKSFSLAGLRVGFGVAHGEIISELMKVKDSYNVNTLSQAAALAALDDYGHMRENVAKIRRTRQRLTGELESLGFDVPPSQANFVLASPAGYPLRAAEIYARLKERKILVRYLNMRRLDNAIRITVGTDEEVDSLLDALRNMS